MKKQNGFTLIELLVVIAIIALLLSVLMPGLAKAKEYARNIICRTNCRSLAIATHLYAEAYGQKLFSYEAGLYINLLSPFIGEADKVRYCPSTVVQRDNPTSTVWGTSKDAWRWASGVAEPENGSYGLSGWCYSYPPGSAGFVGTVERTDYPWPQYGGIEMPSLVPVFFDCAWVDAWPKHTDTVPGTLNLDDPDHGGDNPVNQHIRRLMIRRHYGSVNLAFADAHAEPIDLEHLWNLKWSRVFTPLGGERKRDDGTAIYRKVN